MTYVQYGCGHSAPKEWINFDVSPTLRIQKTPVLGMLMKGALNTTFPENVKYGDIVKGLPIKENSCNGLYCSHVLEHLALEDFRKALKNSFKILKTGGIFRCIVPDLEAYTREYLENLDKGNHSASLTFIYDKALLGIPSRPKSMKAKISAMFGNSHHLWMWDKYSLAEELKNVGFTNIRNCKYNDSADPMFQHVESEDRFIQAVAIECTK